MSNPQPVSMRKSMLVFAAGLALLFVLLSGCELFTPLFIPIEAGITVEEELLEELTYTITAADASPDSTLTIVDPFFSAGARIDTWLQLAATDPNYPNAWLKIETHPIAVLIYNGSAEIFVTGLMTEGAVLHFFKSVPRGGHRRPPRGRS